MPNKCSPHGGTFRVGSLTTGTLRDQDLLRVYADELERLMPSQGAAEGCTDHGRKLANEARNAAQSLDDGDAPDRYDDYVHDVLERLFDQLDEIAMAHDCYFGSLEGDGADIGFWPLEDYHHLVDDDDVHHELTHEEAVPLIEKVWSEWLRERERYLDHRRSVWTPLLFDNEHVHFEWFMEKNPYTLAHPELIASLKQRLNKGEDHA